MRVNRSIPLCTVIPVLIYSDPGTAADWLSNAFGFTVRLRIANHRIQMKAGDGCFTIAEGKVTPNNSHIVQVRSYQERYDKGRAAAQSAKDASTISCGRRTAARRCSCATAAPVT